MVYGSEVKRDCIFYEKSEWGVSEGTVTVVEKEDEKHEQK